MLDDAIDFNLLIGAGGAIRSFKQGATIFKEGDQASELYVVQNGSVRIQLGNRLLSTLYFNDIFGEMALIEGGPRSASAIAATDVTLVTISEKQFLFLVSQTPNFALQVMRAIARRLRTANKSTFW
jgi:CRP-like cAMP-binding protein